MGVQKKKGKTGNEETGISPPIENESDQAIKEETASSGRSRSNSYSQAPVSVAALKVGTRVTILGTENVQQRVPQLEGCIGIIKEAPGKS